MIDYIVKSASQWVVGGIAEFSYWLCLYIALGGYLAHLTGFKNGRKYSSFSLLIYTIIQAFAGAIK